MINEVLKMKGELFITVTDKDGQVVQKIHVPNLVVDTGKAHIAGRVVGTTTTPIGYMAIGTSNVATDATQTALTTEKAREALLTYSATGAVITATATFPEGVGTGAIQEAGLFDASTGGTMMCRTVFAVINKQATDSIAISWKITVA